MRIATEEDSKHAQENSRKEKEAFATCLQKINDHKLEKKLIDVEYTLTTIKYCSILLQTEETSGNWSGSAAVFKTR